MTRPIHVHDQQVYTSTVGEVLFYDSCNANRDNKETLRQLTVHAVRLYTLLRHMGVNQEVIAINKQCI